MESVLQAWQRLRVSEIEQAVIPVEEGADNWPMDKLSLCLAGKLFTEKTFNGSALKNTFQLIWNPKHGMAVRDVGFNVFIFQFFDKNDRQRVMDEGPWCFDDYLLMLCEVDGSIRPSELQFTHAAFWAVVHDLPLGFRGLKTAKAIGDHLGVFLDYDDSDFLQFGPMMRLKVLINVTQPLIRRVTLGITDKSIWAGVQYERLPIFCYFCGKLGHAVKECLVAGKEKSDNGHLQFGPWLHATPKMRGKFRLSRTDLEKEKSWFASLQERGKDENHVSDVHSLETTDVCKKPHEAARLSESSADLENNTKLFSDAITPSSKLSADHHGIPSNSKTPAASAFEKTDGLACTDQERVEEFDPQEKEPLSSSPMLVDFSFVEANVESQALSNKTSTKKDVAQRTGRSKLIVKRNLTPVSSDKLKHDNFLKLTSTTGKRKAIEVFQDDNVLPKRGRLEDIETMDVLHIQVAGDGDIPAREQQ